MKECDNSKLHISSNFILSNCLLHRRDQKACRGYAICTEMQGDYADKLCTSHLSRTVIQDIINKFPLPLILPRKIDFIVKIPTVLSDFN
jgi:hypothetical protein